MPAANSRATIAPPGSRSAAASSVIRDGAPTVIFVTALNDTTDRVKAIEAGGDDSHEAAQPFILGARVRSLLKLKAATDALEQSVRKLSELERSRRS